MRITNSAKCDVCNTLWLEYNWYVKECCPKCGQSNWRATVNPEDGPLIPFDGCLVGVLVVWDES